MSGPRKIQTWRNAEERARGYEEILARAWEMHLAGGGPLPNARMVTEARALRAEANSRLTAVLDAIELATRFEGDAGEARRPVAQAS
jgi:hypothetical protein